MQFKYPDILYFLFFLIVPILVHLFQLRKFQKEYFTNVDFLQNIVIQTRKSSKIKKWLLLLTRLMLFASLIFAFAQPYFPSVDANAQNQDFLIILDNSFSMEAKGSKGPLLKRSIQEILEEIPSDRVISVFTNENDYESNALQNLQTDLQKIDYSPAPFSIEQQNIKLKLNQNSEPKDVFIITDGHQWNSEELSKIHPNHRLYFQIPEAQVNYNIAIDSVFIHQTKDQFYEIGVKISRFGSFENEIPLTIYNQNQVLIKQQLLLEKEMEVFYFTLPKTEILGRVQIEDQSLSFDNSWYFNIGKQKKSKVLCLGDDTKVSFLKKIYTPKDFEFLNKSMSTLDYQIISEQDAIILNELSQIPEALQINLKVFVENGGQLTIIPNQDSDLGQMNTFLLAFDQIKMRKSNEKEKLITKISFNHPLYKGVFEGQVENFQYPKTKAFFEIENKTGNILTYEDQSAFLLGKPYKSGIIYLLANPISIENSNFQQSPLIVPTFFNMARNMKKNQALSFEIGKNNSFILDQDFENEQIVSLYNHFEKFIPLQKIQGSKVALTFTENPKKAGNFTMNAGGKTLGSISFNYSRKESNILKENIQIPENIEITDSISSLISSWEAKRNPNELWKWFLWGALIFLILELLIQKLIQ